MATITKTFKENSGTSARSTWTVTVPAVAEKVVSGNFTLNFPSVTAKYVYSGKNHAYIVIDSTFYIGGYSVSSPDRAHIKYYRSPYALDRVGQFACSIATTSGTTYTLDRENIKTGSINIGDVFTSSNKTLKSLDVIFVAGIRAFSAKTCSESSATYTDICDGNFVQNAEYEAGGSNWGVIGRVTLNAPPTATVRPMTIDKPGYYAGITTASVEITQSSAKYGGDFSGVGGITLTIGNQSTTIHGDGTLSIKLNQAGTFTPTVTIKDSRGQVTTETLPPITVFPYSISVSNTAADRVDSSTYRKHDEGANAVVRATFSHGTIPDYFLEPTLTVDGEPYVITNDLAVDKSITYYEKSNQGEYSPVTPVGIESPHDEDWYVPIYAKWYDEWYPDTGFPDIEIDTVGGITFGYSASYTGNYIMQVDLAFNNASTIASEQCPFDVVMRDGDSTMCRICNVGSNNMHVDNHSSPVVSYQIISDEEVRLMIESETDPSHGWSADYMLHYIFPYESYVTVGRTNIPANTRNIYSDSVSLETSSYVNVHTLTVFIESGDSIVWDEYLPESPISLYARIAHEFERDTRYLIGVALNTTMGSTDLVETTLAPGFYLLSARDTGRWFGIGMKPTSPDLHVGMEASLYKSVNIQKLDETVGEIFDVLYPVGSVYISSENVNPSSEFGGSWTLIDKKLKYSQINNTWFTFNTTNTQNGTSMALLNGDSIEIRLAWKNKSALSDNTLAIGTFNGSSIGLASANHAVYVCGFNDGSYWTDKSVTPNVNYSGSIGMFATSWNTDTNVCTISVWDWATRPASYPTTVDWCYLNFVFVVGNNLNMLDTFCDRFYWERTA